MQTHHSFSVFGIISRFCGVRIDGKEQKRDKKAAKRFFKKMLGNAHSKSPRVVNTDKAKAFPPAFEEAQAEGIIPKKTKHRSQKYMNNIQEQDHRPTKRRVRQSQWFQSFHTAKWTIDGYESMHILRKG